MAVTKDPSAVLDYRVDWAAWLAESETITASTWTVETGLTKGAESHDTTSATVWVSGGTLGVQYGLTNHITTNQGRQDERTLMLTVRDRFI